MESRARYTIALGMIAAVALVTMVVQQSESGLVHELEGEQDSLDLGFRSPSVEGDFSSEEFSLINIDESKSAGPRKIIGHLIDLRAYCKMAKRKAQELLSKSTTNSALPSFIVAFAAEPPVPRAPPPVIKDGIKDPRKWSPPAFNVVTWYAKAMGAARKKYAKTGGIDSYVLDNIDASIVNGHRAVLATQNEHKKQSSRIQINPAAMGVTEAPNYIKVLDQPNLEWAQAVHKDEKAALSADILRAASFLKAGAQNTYQSFMKEAVLREHAKYERYHTMEVKAALQKIQTRYATDSGSDAIKNIQMLPSAGKEGADTVPKPEVKSQQDIKEDAKKAAEDFVAMAKGDKSNIKTQIKVVEKSQ